MPGAGPSVDQLISHWPGLIPQSTGSLLKEKITAVTFFVDHFSGYIYGHLMCNTSMKQMLEAKQAYERHASSHGVDVIRYRADNGQFSNPKFLQAVESADQTITFCAVGGHHQNGITKKKIGDVTALARTVLQHAKRNWTEVITVSLWPFALKYAILLSNTLSMDENGNTPLSKLTITTVDSTNLDLQNFHTFGCPCYVLDHRLQSGSIGPPKWDPRSQLRISVGFSPHHSCTVAMVLNPNTGSVSPQFHVIFDDHFQTLKFLSMDTTPQFWSDFCRNLESDSSDFDLHPATTVPMDTAAASSHHGGDTIMDASDSAGAVAPNDDQDLPVSLGHVIGAVIPSGGERSTSHDDSSNDEDKDNPYGAYHRQFLNLETAGLRRSLRDPKLSDKVKSSSMNFKKILGSFAAVFASISALYTLPFPFPMCLFIHTMEHSLATSQLIDNTFNSIPIFSLVAQMEQNKVYTYKEAMK
jgi:Integrase core domain.